MGDQTKDVLPRILVLGGTGEGSEISALLADRVDLTVISSLAGRVSQPKLPCGVVRVGGFGGVDGLKSYLIDEKIRAVIDATHPFAVRISRNAEVACNHLGLPLIALIRPPWTQEKDDLWHEVPDFQSAASFVGNKPGRVFLSIGRQELGSFAECKDAWLLIRAIEEPSEQLPPNRRIILQRGPFGLEEELQLLRDYSIDYVVSKNSGGSATYTKIEAARLLGIPVVMIKRPPKHTVPTVETVEKAATELDHLLQKA